MARRMEGKERKQSTDSFSSMISMGRGAGSETSDGRRSRLLSLSSITTSVMRRPSSRVEVVDMPGGSMLVKVNEDSESTQGSVEGARTIAGMMGATDTNLVDKIIKQEMAHHSPAVGAPREEQKDSEEVENDAIKPREGEDDGDESERVLAFGATNILQHLHLALASPTLFRLPALAYKWSSNEGSGFLAAYTVLLLLIGLPLSVMEQTLAQFSSLGPTTIFRCLPILAGVGVGMVGACAVLIPYTSTVLSWSVRYTLDCLQPEVPWSKCPSGSNTSGCPDELAPSEYYFMRTVLGTTRVDDDQGWTVVLSLGLTQTLLWLALILAVWRGEAWRTGTLSRVWSLVTAGALVVQVVYGLQRPESGDGLGRAFIFNWRDLDKPDIWLDAFGQVLWSMGPCIGLLINRASYRHFRDRIRLDAYTAIVSNLLVGMASCLAVFPFLVSRHFVEKTPGFFLVEASKAVTHMEVPQIGGVLLYLGLCKALFDHTQILASTVSVGVSDLLPGRWRSGSRFFLCCATVCVFGFMASLPFITHEGIFLVRAVDTYSPWASGLFLGMVEVAGLVYLYGANNIGQHFRLMLRSDVRALVFVWRFLLLPFLLALGVWACVTGVSGPVEWEDLQRAEETEEAYRIGGVVVSLLPAALALVATVLLLLRHTKVIRRLLVPAEAWGPALAGHRALYTPGILRAKTKAPYLVVQVDVEGNADMPDKGWLPFGFFWVPSKSETHLLANNDAPTQVLLARYLKSRFSGMSCGDINPTIGDDDEEDDDDGIQEGEAEEQWTQTGTPSNSTNTVSSGVLLQPKNLPEDRTQHLHR
ncbi:sodium-dependent serotonin transporter-like isoform X2 [Scylla paramamosain]|uniref:sodium-dependent serotonin transporter-like isoform X2 n=1 Tax=Scylla paramamosain TaxID=85552 RepID=UPI003083AE55